MKALTRLMAVSLASLVALGTLALPASAQAAPSFTQRMTSWNVIGIDSNKPETEGPDTFQVGMRFCNTGGTATGVQTTFAWTSANANLALVSPATQQFGTLAPNGCINASYDVRVTRVKAAQNTARRFTITLTNDQGVTVTTPVPREVYVAKLTKQNRNSITAITGPNSVYVGGVYQYVLDATTATNGYDQVVAALNLPAAMFEVLNVATTYSSPAGATNDRHYADACGWDHNPDSPTYNSCIGPVQFAGGKAGGTIRTTYTVRARSAGNATVKAIIYDASGNARNYNSDFDAVSTSVTSLASSDVHTMITPPEGEVLVQGVPGRWRVDVGNFGPSTSGPITTTLTMPDALSNSDWNGAFGSGWTCGEVSPSTLRITCTRGALAADTSASPIWIDTTYNGFGFEPMAAMGAELDGGDGDDDWITVSPILSISAESTSPVYDPDLSNNTYEADVALRSPDADPDPDPPADDPGPDPDPDPPGDGGGSGDPVPGDRALAGTVFTDLNGDGIRDENETGRGGVTVKVFADPEGDSSFSQLVGEVTTASDGTWSLNELPAGRYLIAVMAPDATVATTDSVVVLDLTETTSGQFHVGLIEVDPIGLPLAALAAAAAAVAVATRRFKTTA
jgi:hypothetical protein